MKKNSNAFVTTIEEVAKLCNKEKLPFLLTRYEKDYSEVSDLDILVQEQDFERFVKVFKKHGYSTHSHDHALGGRKKGAQINLTKQDKVKIDLHKDFTWRRSHYIDLGLLWKNTRKHTIGEAKVQMPNRKLNIFLIVINILFEKTYVTKADIDLLNSLSKDFWSDDMFLNQARKYGCSMSWKYIGKWWRHKGTSLKKTSFIPVWIILFSYIEKIIEDRYIDIVSFLYYIFFRSRYLVTKTLPYE